MNYYFKCFNETNKLNKYIRDENKGLWPPRPIGLDYINYETAQAPRDQRSHDLILDFIYENIRVIKTKLIDFIHLNISNK